MKKSEAGNFKGTPYYITQEVYGDIEIYGPFNGITSNTDTVGWDEKEWLAHEAFAIKQQKGEVKRTLLRIAQKFPEKNADVPSMFT